MSGVVASAEEIPSGVHASQVGRYDDAIAILTRVIESGTETDVILYHLARSLFKVKKFSESVRYWEGLLTHRSDLKIKIEINLAAARYLAARAEAEQGRYRQAISLLNQYLEHYPGDQKAKSIMDQLEKLAVDAETVRNFLAAAADHIKAERWSDASDEFLAIGNIKKEEQS